MSYALAKEAISKTNIAFDHHSCTLQYTESADHTLVCLEILKPMPKIFDVTYTNFTLADIEFFT